MPGTVRFSIRSTAATLMTLLCWPAAAQLTTDTASLPVSTVANMITTESLAQPGLLAVPADRISIPTTETLGKSPELVPAPIATPTPVPEVASSRRRASRLTAPGYDMPEWFVEAVRDGSYKEEAGVPAKTLPYSAALATQSAFTSEPHTMQPAGALSGKIVYLMAGHGWTYSEERMNWFTQRGITHGIVEDFGNLDQMHIFAHYCWNAGATIVPLRPVDHQLNERILDNTSPQTEFYGTWSESTSPIYHGTRFDEVPYLYTSATLTQTALARYRPWIPEAGNYPVYCWARDGEDRVNQCYRVVHSGGVTEVRVDHRRVGKGWVWLGTFHFEKGDGGYVEISNAVCDPYEADGRSVIIADGIRFGNGYGDVPRPGGISGFPKEDEGDCYWIAQSLGHTADHRIYTLSQDSFATVSSPPKTAAYLNRETDGRFFDRVLVSFHSNALAGKSRGAVGLYNENPDQRPDYQEKLAEQLGRHVNQELVKSPSLQSPKWAPRARYTYNGINFGELRKDYLQNEMCATIIETAFHDNVEDAAFLLDPASRMDMARACLRGLTKWFAQVSESSLIAMMQPTPPQRLSARMVDRNKATVSWSPGPADAIVGDPALDYRVYLSHNGRGFGAGHATDGATSFDVEGISSQTATFFRVVGVNAGGESWASETMALFPGTMETTASAQQTTRVLVITSPSRLDRSTNFEQAKGIGLGFPTPPLGTTLRVRPRVTLVPETLIATADALTTLGIAFDSVEVTALSTTDNGLSNYAAILWVQGENDSDGDMQTTTTQQLLKNALKKGTRVILAGPTLGKVYARANLERSAPAQLRISELALDKVTDAQNRAKLVMEWLAH